MRTFDMLSFVKEHILWKKQKANTNNYSGNTVNGCIGLKLNVFAFAYANDNIKFFICYHISLELSIPFLENLNFSKIMKCASFVFYGIIIKKGGANMTITELKDYIANKEISGVVVNIVDSFHHITITDTEIVFYNNDDENNYTSITDRLTIPIKEIKEIDFSETSSIITLYPFARLLLVLQKN